MFRLVLLIGLLFLLPLQANSVKPEIFFEQIKSLNEKQLPDFFKVRIESSVVDLQKKTFPPEMIEFNREPILYLYFKKGHSPRLHLEGVLEYYANYFSPYEEVIQNAGIFLGVDNYPNFKKFSQEFLIKANKTSYGYRFKVREREGLPGDYGEYFYNQEMKLNRIDFYQEGDLHGNMKIFFKEIDGGKIVPSKALIRYQEPEIGGLKEFSILFTDYQTDPKLGETFFLQ